MSPSSCRWSPRCSASHILDRTRGARRDVSAGHVAQGLRAARADAGGGGGRRKRILIPSENKRDLARYPTRSYGDPVANFATRQRVRQSSRWAWAKAILRNRKLAGLRIADSDVPPEEQTKAASSSGDQMRYDGNCRFHAAGRRSQWEIGDCCGPAPPRDPCAETDSLVPACLPVPSVRLPLDVSCAASVDRASV